MVDDDGDFQFIMRQWLTPRYDTVSLADSEDLLEDLRLLTPDMLILDVKLPGPDGFQLCRKIRSEPGFESLPILFLTACASDSDFVHSLEVGGSTLLTKPVSRRALLERIKELLA